MDKDCLREILAYVDAHIREKITLPDLARLAGYSPFYFSRLFSERMGMPVTGYIRIRKLQYAASSLMEGKKVLEVSLLYAFDSQEGFSRAFKALFGSTPGTVKRHMTSYHVPPYPLPDDHPTRRNLMEKQTCQSLQENLQQLVYEALSESLAEAREGHCTEISLCVLKDGSLEITDNGRGIPLSGNSEADRAVLDKILSGRPISNLEYSQMGDFSRIGMQTVNSLCERLSLCVWREGLRFTQDYVRGIPQHELISCRCDHPSGTRILMQPDRAIFQDLRFSCERLREWLKDNGPDPLRHPSVRIHITDL